MQVQKGVLPLLTGMALVIGVFIGVLGLFLYQTATGKVPTAQYNLSNDAGIYDANYINSVIDIFNTRYLSDLDPSNTDYTYGMIKGFIESLDDPYTSFFSPEEAEDYKDQSAGNFEGIGVVLGYDGSATFIETVLKGFPAEGAGVLPRDIVLAVNGLDVIGKTPAEVAPLIRGERGTKVELKLFRGESELSLSIERNYIDVDNVSWEKIGEYIAKIDISQFSDTSLQAFISNWDNVVSEVNSQMPSTASIIVDLRNNPGGYVAGVQYVLEEFLTDGQIMMKERTKDQREKVYKDERDGLFETRKVVVLVNEGSASASEIFASAIKENGKGKIVGQPTVGKGVEQDRIELTDGSILVLVFQEWLTPNGNKITKETPVTPDEIVGFTEEDFLSNSDPQLEKAIELAK